jgi:hypothetical protein
VTGEREREREREREKKTKYGEQFWGDQKTDLNDHYPEPCGDGT